MVICELCGSANVEIDEHCRVCGQALGVEPVAQQPLVAQAAVPVTPEPVQIPVAAAPAAVPAPPEPIQIPVAPVAATHAPVSMAPEPAQTPLAAVREPIPVQPPMPAPPPVEHEPASRSLQMSAFAEPVEAAAPPMLGGVAEVDPAPANQPGSTSVPGFMQPGGRSANAPEPVQLVSANDLPDWLKQIAEQDAAKAAAEAEAQAAHHDAPASIVKRALPGETHAATRTTNWLSKSGPSSDSPDHWDSSEIASANWGAVEAPVAQAGETEYPTIIPPTAFVPSSTEAYSTPKSKKKLSLGSKAPKQPKAPKAPKASSQSGGTPIYRNQTVQLIVLVGLIVILAGMLLL